MPRATNKHHLWYPKSAYQTGLERTFRELPCNIVELAVGVHNLLHDCSEPPRKPQTFEMVAAVRKHENHLCPCYVKLINRPRRNRKLDALD